MREWILVGMLLAVAAGAFFISIRSFQEKGFLFNNAYLYASKEERSRMDKKPHYRQTAIVFFLIGIVFVINALEGIFQSGFLLWAGLFFTAVTIVYAVASSIWIERKRV